MAVIQVVDYGEVLERTLLEDSCDSSQEVPVRVILCAYIDTFKEALNLIAAAKIKYSLVMLVPKTAVVCCSLKTTDLSYTGMLCSIR